MSFIDRQICGKFDRDDLLSFVADQAFKSPNKILSGAYAISQITVWERSLAFLCRRPGFDGDCLVHFNLKKKRTWSHRVQHHESSRFLFTPKGVVLAENRPTFCDLKLFSSKGKPLASLVIDGANLSSNLFYLLINHFFLLS